MYWPPPAPEKYVSNLCDRNNPTPRDEHSKDSWLNHALEDLGAVLAKCDNAMVDEYAATVQHFGLSPTNDVAEPSMAPCCAELALRNQSVANPVRRSMLVFYCAGLDSFHGADRRYAIAVRDYAAHIPDSTFSSGTRRKVYRRTCEGALLYEIGLTVKEIFR